MRWRLADLIAFERGPAAFLSAGLPRHTPHAFRHMLNKLAYAEERSLPFAKAMGENLGHRDMKITNRAYGRMTLEERCEILMHGTKRDGQVTSNIESTDRELLREARDLLKRNRGD